MSLLEKAKASSIGNSRRKDLITEEVELAIAYVKNEIVSEQVRGALEKDKDFSADSWAKNIVMRAIRKGYAEINLKK